MAASVATLGFGANLLYGTAGQTSLQTSVAFAEPMDLDFPDPEVSTPEITHQASPSQWREFTAGLKDGGSCTFEGNYIEAEFTTLYGFMATKKAWNVVWSTASGSGRAYFDAYLTKCKATGPINDPQKTTITLRVTGAVNFAAS